MKIEPQKTCWMVAGTCEKCKRKSLATDGQKTWCMKPGCGWMKETK